MRRLNSCLFATPLLSVALAVPFCSQAQSQDESVAEAARRAREQKKSAASRPSPVITDDTLKRSALPEPTASSPVPTPADKSPTKATNKSGDTTGKPDESLRKLKADLEETKEKLAGAQHALDLSKRELALQQDNVYSKPNYQTDSTGQDKIEELKQQVTERTAMVEDFKARVADLQAKLDAQAAGAATPAAPNPPQP